MHKKLTEVFLPRLLIPSRRGLPPVVACAGTMPSQAEKSRPLRKADPFPTVAIMRVEANGPIPGISIKR